MAKKGIKSSFFMIYFKGMGRLGECSMLQQNYLIRTILAAAGYLGTQYRDPEGA